MKKFDPKKKTRYQCLNPECQHRLEAEYRPVCCPKCGKTTHESQRRKIWMDATYPGLKDGEAREAIKESGPGRRALRRRRKK